MEGGTKKKFKNFN